MATSVPRSNAQRIGVLLRKMASDTGKLKRLQNPWSKDRNQATDLHYAIADAAHEAKELATDLLVYCRNVEESQIQAATVKKNRKAFPNRDGRAYDQHP